MQKPKVEEPMARTRNAESSSSFQHSDSAKTFEKGLESAEERPTQSKLMAE